MSIAAADLMPHCDEAERAICGAVLINPDAYREVVALTGLRGEQFRQVGERAMWESFARLTERGLGIDYLTLVKDLEAAGKLKDAGGSGGVLALINETPSSLNADGWAKLVIAAWWRRQKLLQLQEGARLVHDGSKTLNDIDAGIHDLLAGNGVALSHHQPASVLFGNFIDDVQARAKQQPGLDAGLFEFNAVFAGRWRLGEYTIIQGLANLGKSFFLAQLANAACPQVPVLYFTFEGMAADVRDRMIAMRSGVPLDEILSGQFKDDNAKRALDASMWYTDKRLEIIDNAASVEEVRRQVEAAILRYDFARPMVFIDNLNNVAEHMRGRDYENLTYVSAKLLEMVRQTGCGVTASAQQNNMYDPVNGYDRNRRSLIPSMRTIEGARKLAQHPHNMYGLYSSDYIAEKLVKGEWVDPDCPPGHMMLVNCRQRNARGAVSAVVRWNKAVPRFETKQPTFTPPSREPKTALNGEQASEIEQARKKREREQQKPAAVLAPAASANGKRRSYPAWTHVMAGYGRMAA